MTRLIPLPLIFVVVSTLTGCESAPTSDQVIPIARVPPDLMAKARRELPGITFDTVYKLKVNNVDAYEIRGKNARGKIREIELSATGDVLEIE